MQFAIERDCETERDEGIQRKRKGDSETEGDIARRERQRDTRIQI